MTLRFDNREPCASCPYRRDAPLGLWSPVEFENLLEQDKKQFGHQFGCHEFNKRKAEARVCIGWLLNQRERGVPNLSLRLTLMKNEEAGACMRDASSPAELFDTIEEMAEANDVE